MAVMINLIINIVQSFLLIHFLIQCFDVKKIELSKKAIYGIGIITTVLYLELPEIFSQGNNSLYYVIIAIVFCHLFLKGQLIEQTLYSILLIAVTIYTSILVASIVGLIKGLNYIQVRDTAGMLQYCAMAFTQLILGIVLHALAKYKKRVHGAFHAKYTFIYVLIPIISVILCTAVLEMFHSDVIRKNEQILIIMLGIFLLNILVTYLYLIQHRYYNQALDDALQISSYKQHESNLKEIRRIYNDTEKNRHEIKRVIRMTLSLLELENISEAKAYLQEFDNTRIEEENRQIFVEHIVLNAIISQKMEACKNNGIMMNCLVTGEMNGVTDLDLHILLDNLLDNAIEASLQSEQKKVDVVLSANESCIILEIGNSTYDNVLENNKRFLTSKKEKALHGYGIKNVRDIIDKYHGNLSYQMKSETYIQCKAILLKNI